MGGAFCTPSFWDHGQVTPNPKKLGWGCNFAITPFWAPRILLPFFAVLDS